MDMSSRLETIISVKSLVLIESMFPLSLMLIQIYIYLELIKNSNLMIFVIF